VAGCPQGNADTTTSTTHIKEWWLALSAHAAGATTYSKVPFMVIFTVPMAYYQNLTTARAHT